MFRKLKVLVLVALLALAMSLQAASPHTHVVLADGCTTSSSGCSGG